MRELTTGELRFIDESTNNWRMYIYSKSGAKAMGGLQEQMNVLSEQYKEAFSEFYKNRIKKDSFADSIEIKNEFDKAYEKKNPAFYDINALIGREVKLVSEVIEADNLNTYISYMNNGEIIGVMEGRLTGIGVSNELDKKPEGLGIIEIFPEYICIHRIDTCMDVSEQAILDSIVKHIRQMPKADELPIYMFETGEDRKTKLEEVGFIRDKRQFMYELGMSSDLKKITFDKKSEMNVVLLEEVEEDEVLAFLMNAPYDPFFQIPYSDIKADNLSGSIVCKNKDRILAMILVEDDDRFIKIPWYYYKDKDAADACFFVLKKLIKNDYDSDMPILFLDSGKNKKELMGYFSEKIKEVPVHAYRLKP